MVWGSFLSLKMLHDQSNLWIQHNSYQHTNGLFHRTRINIPKLHMEAQKTPNSNSNLKKEEQSWEETRHLIPKQHGTGMKTDIRSMEQSETRNEPMPLWSINI